MKEFNDSEDNIIQKEEKKEDNKDKDKENKNIEFFLKEKKDIKKKENQAKELENKKHYHKSLYENQQENERLRKLYNQQKHLFEHKKDRKDPLINIYSKNLQNEYIKEVNYYHNNSIITIILSLLIISQDYLILKNYKSYNENILSLIFSSFSFFISVFILIELYRSALRDQIRYILYKFFALFLSAILFCLFISHVYNSFIIFDKIKQKKEKQGKKINIENLFNNNLIDNVILIMAIINCIGILIVIKYQLWLGYNSIRIIFGFDLEVFQKQILEDKKVNKQNKPNKQNNKEKEINIEELHDKQD